MIVVHPRFAAGKGFCICMCAFSTNGGHILLRLCCAPLNEVDLKAACQDQNLDMASPVIPTTAIKLPSAASFFDIVSTRKGWSTDTFHKIKNKSDDEDLTDPHKSFSLILNVKHGKQTLDLASRDRETRDKWHQEVRNIVRELKERREQKTHRDFIGDLYKSADKEDKGFLNKDKFAEVWVKIKVDMKESKVDNIFKKADTHGSMGVSIFSIRRRVFTLIFD